MLRGVSRSAGDQRISAIWTLWSQTHQAGLRWSPDTVPGLLQGIQGVPRIRDGYNPATWALDVTNGASERRLERDFADVYEASALHK